MLATIGPVELRVRIMSGEVRAIGPGKAAVLEAIQAYGSISASGRALGISYKRCWALVDEMNRCWREPLVATRRGGSAQGATLTPLGEQVLAAYRRLETRLLETVRDDPAFADICENLRAHPIAAADGGHPRGVET